MIKVLYLINHAGKAGTERYVISLIKKLHNNKIEAHFVYNETGLLVDWVEELGIDPYRIVMNSPFDIIAVKKLKTFCKKKGIQIIHTNFLRENYLAMLSKIANKNLKVFYTNHFIMEKRETLKYANKLFNPLQEQVIAVCNKGKDLMIENGIDANKIEVIFNGVDVAQWSAHKESTLRSEYNIKNDEFVFLCGSRFAHDKGHEFLIKSVARLKEITTAKFKCVLANDGPLLLQCQELTKKLGLENDIIFTGYRKDIKNLIYGSDLYVNSSEHEALSFAIIEVLACGVPVIATNMAGNGDIINSKTKCGILVEYNNELQLALNIKNMIENVGARNEFKINAIKAANNTFNLDNMIEKTYNLYQRCLNK